MEIETEKGLLNQNSWFDTHYNYCYF